MIKFVYERPTIHDPYSAVKSIEMILEDERSMDEMLDAYREFLLSLGYQVNGEIVVQPHED